MTSFDDCLSKGLIRAVPPSPESAASHMHKAEQLLEESQADLKEARFNSAAIIGYVAAFNAAKALMARDGFREKSHFCVARFLEARYGQEVGLDLIALFDVIRDMRHGIQYSAEYLAGEKQAREITAFAEKFVEKIGKQFA